MKKVYSIQQRIIVTPNIQDTKMPSLVMACVKCMVMRGKCKLPNLCPFEPGEEVKYPKCSLKAAKASTTLHFCILSCQYETTCPPRNL